MALITQRASTSSSPSAESSTPRLWKYDVFLSFRGVDTRRGFISHLFHELQYWQTINTFKDDREIEVGESISPKLLRAIEESHLAIVVLSPNYASSTWCLDELAKIIESMESKGENTILPVFFNVDPCDVRYQRGSFAEDFAKHEERCDDKEKVKSWRAALEKVANLSGWDFKKKYGCERELIKDIVRYVWRKVHPVITLLDSTDMLVGMDFALAEMKLLLAHEVNDVRFIGIWGMGGVGKTTLAKLVFEKISHHFEVRQFLLNVRDVSARHGTLVNLQKQLLSSILKKNITQVWDEEQGTSFIRKCFFNKKVLLVVDDVDHYNQLELLARKKSWFGEGSRIIITTRDARLLTQHDDIKFSFKVNGLPQAEALELFKQNAFRRDEPGEDFMQLSKGFVGYAKGLPLALKTMGRSLYKRNLDMWNSELDKLEKIPIPTIFDCLKISFDPLDDMERNIFLDIAFFYKGMKKGHIIEMLESCGLCGLIIGIDVLIEKALLTMEKNNNVEVLGMHHLIQEMAKEIVRRESPDEPGQRSRLCHGDDIFHIFQQNTGTQAIKGIRLCLPKFEEADSSWTNECFTKMPNLTYLELDNLLIPSSPKFLPNSLRSLKWSWYPSKSLPANYRPNWLVELEMKESKLDRLWDGKLDLPNLKYMNLIGSGNLTKTPDFTGCPNLETLDLTYCTGLVEIHPTIAVHKKIKILKLMWCGRLESIPSEIDMESLQDFQISCHSIKIPSFTSKVKNLSILYVSDFIEWAKPRLRDLDLRNLPSICALRSLTELSISNAKLCEGALPDDFGKLLPSLTELDLSGNDFESLPSTIKFLSALENFNIKGCRRLKRLPDLPSNALLSVWAGNCACLEFLSEPSSHLSRFAKMDYFLISCENCSGLDDDEGWNNGIFWMLRRLAAQGINYRFNGFDIISPGSKISEWFNNQREGDSLTIELPSNVESCASKWMGLAVCVVFSNNAEYSFMRRSTIRCFWSVSPFVVFEWFSDVGGDHVLVSYIHHTYIQIKDRTTFPINFQCQMYCSESHKDINIPVTRCGARLVYERDLEELLHGGMEATCLTGDVNIVKTRKRHKI